MKTNLLDLSIEEVSEAIEQIGEAKYRADQIRRWVYSDFVSGFDEMTNLPIRLRESLKERYCVGSPTVLCQVASKRDETRKFLFELSDGETIESVFLVDGARKTVCLSSQVGCKLGCVFCATGRTGFVRNLTSGEILGQILQISRIHGRPSNLVFMGMGEPLLNLPEVEKSLMLINDPRGLGIGARKVTISTSGIAPGIRRLAELGPQVNLALSLNAAYDDLRSRLMPVNRRYPLAQVLEACRDYSRRTGRQITLEYVVIKGVNSNDKDASELAKIARSLSAAVNLISYNPIGDANDAESGTAACDVQRTLRSPPNAEITAFRESLARRGVTAKIRYRRGRDIKAGCGQLRRAGMAERDHGMTG